MDPILSCFAEVILIAADWKSELLRFLSRECITHHLWFIARSVSLLNLLHSTALMLNQPMEGTHDSGTVSVPMFRKRITVPWSYIYIYNLSWWEGGFWILSSAKVQGVFASNPYLGYGVGFVRMDQQDKYANSNTLLVVQTKFVQTRCRSTRFGGWENC